MVSAGNCCDVRRPSALARVIGADVSLRAISRAVVPGFPVRFSLHRELIAALRRAKAVERGGLRHVLQMAGGLAPLRLSLWPQD
jgi:hypothetical protein